MVCNKTAHPCNEYHYSCRFGYRHYSAQQGELNSLNSKKNKNFHCRKNVDSLSSDLGRGLSEVSQRISVLVERADDFHVCLHLEGAEFFA